MSKYETGPRQYVIERACYYAVQYEQSFIEAISPKYGEPDEDTKILIKDSESHIRDFKKLGNLD